MRYLMIDHKRPKAKRFR